MLFKIKFSYNSDWYTIIKILDNQGIKYLHDLPFVYVYKRDLQGFISDLDFTSSQEIKSISTV